MNRILLLACLASALPGRAQAPAMPPVAAQPAAPDNLSFAEPPTRKKPFVIEGRMTVTKAAPAFAKSAGGMKSKGSMGNEGLAENPASDRKDPSKADKGSGGAAAGDNAKSNASYTLQVPPKTRLMVRLNCKRLRDFQLKFISETLDRTEDPGLFVNKIQHRYDAAFYENRTDQVKTIHCVLVGIENMDNEPYSLVFTDY